MMKYPKFKAGEKPGTYLVETPVTAEDILTMARQLARQRLAKGTSITQPTAAFQYLQASLRHYEYEVFGVLFLDNKNRVIAFEELFRGTLDAAAVYPREIVKRALECSAAAVILVHNHPSGCAEPSESDKAITWRIRDALNLLDIQTLDHVIVGADTCVSLAERGII
jgi:DNA repair protein RadC